MSHGGILPCVLDEMNGLILRCTTLCVPSSIRKRNDGGIRTAMMIVLDMPVTTIIMVVSDISVMAVGSCPRAREFGKVFAISLNGTLVVAKGGPMVTSAI